MSRRTIFPALDQAKAELKAILDKVPGDVPIKSAGSYLSAEDIARMRQLNAEIDRLEDVLRSCEKARAHPGGAADGDGAKGGAGARTLSSTKFALSPAARWAAAVADSVFAAARQVGVKAITSGSIEIPTLISTDVFLPERYDRLIDLLVDRQTIETNEFEFLRQTARSTQAAPVPDLAQKPTSSYTFTPVLDRVRVIAHLSEPIPERFFADYTSLIQVLEGEMFSGLLDALEAQIVAGDGTGENMTGVINTTGVTVVPFASDVLTTLRKARTAFQAMHETPTGWVINPADAEELDLLREDSSGAFLAAGPGFSNIFGDIPIVVSTSVPPGTALLGDWRQVRVFVRENMRLDADRSGPNFERNQVILRAEGRFGIGVLRPQAIAVVHLSSN